MGLGPNEGELFVEYAEVRKLRLVRERAAMEENFDRENLRNAGLYLLRCNNFRSVVTHFESVPIFDLTGG